MNPFDWTVSFRPLRLLRNLVLVLAFLTGVGWAEPISTSEEPLPRAPLSEAVLANRHAVAAVETVLCDRMVELDPGRRADLAQTIVDDSLGVGVDPLLILAIIQVESGYDWEAVSPTGARGLMQVLPSTWKDMVSRYGLGRLEKFNPVHNARVGIHFVGFLIEQGIRRPESLLLAYNQGMKVVLAVNDGATVPDEAQAFIPRVLNAYKALLAKHGVPAKDMRKVWRAPWLTILHAPEVAYEVASR